MPHNVMPMNVLNAISTAVNTMEGQQLEEVIYHLFKLLGGPKGLSGKLYDHIINSPAGSQSSQRFFDLVLRMLHRMEEKRGGLGKIDDADTESLENRARELIAKGTPPFCPNCSCPECSNTKASINAAQSADPADAGPAASGGRSEEVPGTSLAAERGRNSPDGGSSFGSRRRKRNHG